MAASDIRIEPVVTQQDLNACIMFPFELYKSDPYWVPPLISERKVYLNQQKNPFFEHAEMQLFRAVRGGKTIGAIAAVADELHPQIWNEPVGFFGIFEVIEEYEVAARLLSAAREWLAVRGREVMRGPMNLNINDECGLLIDGFDGTPVIMMTYNPPYYQAFLERYGMVKAKDLYAYKADIVSFGPNLEHLPTSVSRVARIARDRYNVQIRPIVLKRLDKEVALIKPIYRQAWAKNWGEVPITDGEFDYLVNNLRQVVDPDLTFLAFIDGEVVGCFVTLPDYNQVVHHLNGRLLPFGWAKFLWYKRKITGVRILIMGVLEEHRLKGITSLFFQEACRVAIRRGYQWAELSWILEDNYKIIRGIETMGGEIYRTYRIYDITTAR